MELKRLHVCSRMLCILHHGEEWWVAPALCTPPLSWVQGSQLRSGLDTPLPDTPSGHFCTVATAAVMPLLLPAEAAALKKKHPRSTFLMSLPAALRNLRKMSGKAQWRAMADDVSHRSA